MSVIEGKYHFEPRARLISVTETVFLKPDGSGHMGTGKMYKLLLSQEELMEKVGKPEDGLWGKTDKGYEMTYFGWGNKNDDRFSISYKKDEGDFQKILRATYWGRINLVEADEVVETPDGRYKMKPIHPNEGERRLRQMSGEYKRVERKFDEWSLAEVLFDKDSNIGVGLVWEPAGYPYSTSLRK